MVGEAPDAGGHRFVRSSTVISADASECVSRRLSMSSLKSSAFTYVDGSDARTQPGPSMIYEYGGELYMGTVLSTAKAVSGGARSTRSQLGWLNVATVGNASRAEPACRTAVASTAVLIESASQPSLVRIPGTPFLRQLSRPRCVVAAFPSCVDLDVILVGPRQHPHYPAPDHTRKGWVGSAGTGQLPRSARRIARRLDFGIINSRMTRVKSRV